MKKLFLDYMVRLSSSLIYHSCMCRRTIIHQPFQNQVDLSITISRHGTIWRFVAKHLSGLNLQKKDSCLNSRRGLYLMTRDRSVLDSSKQLQRRYSSKNSGKTQRFRPAPRRHLMKNSRFVGLVRLLYHSLQMAYNARMREMEAMSKIFSSLKR